VSFCISFYGLFKWMWSFSRVIPLHLMAEARFEVLVILTWDFWWTKW
jgi:hypothetical protein